MPDEAKEAIGHGIRAKRSKSGAVRIYIITLSITFYHNSTYIILIL